MLLVYRTVGCHRPDHRVHNRPRGPRCRTSLHQKVGYMYAPQILNFTVEMPSYYLALQLSIDVKKRFFTFLIPVTFSNVLNVFKRFCYKSVGINVTQSSILAISFII